MIAPYPTSDTGAFDAQAEQEMELNVFDPVRQLRNERVENKVPPGKIIDVTIIADVARATVEAHAPTIDALAKVNSTIISPSEIPSDIDLSEEKLIISKGRRTIMHLEAKVDRGEEKSRLLKEIESGKAEITRIENLLANESFTSKAPASVVEKERRKLAERKDTLTRLEERLAGLG
jgi:valyl-tRNA synthetase